MDGRWTKREMSQGSRFAPSAASKPPLLTILPFLLIFMGLVTKRPEIGLSPSYLRRCGTYITETNTGLQFTLFNPVLSSRSNGNLMVIKSNGALSGSTKGPCLSNNSIQRGSPSPQRTSNLGIKSNPGKQGVHSIPHISVKIMKWIRKGS